MKAVSLDFETYYQKGEYDIRSLGAWRYCNDERFDPFLVSVSDGSETWSGSPAEFNWDALRGNRLLSHNSSFDGLVYQTMVKRGMAPALEFESWRDTAALTTYLCMRRDLARASEFLLGAAVDKSYREDADGKHWADMVAAGVAEKVKEAGRVDALRCWQLHAKYGHLMPEREWKLSDLTIRQGQRGVQINESLLKEYLRVAQTMLIQAEAELPWMKEGKKPTSPKAVAEEARKVGIPAPPVKSRDGEDVYDAWADAYGPKHRWVKAYTDYRVINKFITGLQTIYERLHPDAVLSFDLLYFGAHTGRWSGSGGINFQNFRKEPLYCDTDGRLITDVALLREIASSKKLPGYVAHSLDVRALFIARHGRKLIISDLSQIEPRVLAWLVNDTAMLASMAAGQSPYQAHAESTMSWTRGDMKALIKSGDGEAKELYALAKARVLGLGYGCGWKKFITVAQVMAGLDITEGEPEFEPMLNAEGQPCFDKDGQPKMQSGYGSNSRKIVKDYRASNPLIAGLWKTLDTAFRDSVGGDFTLTLPSGRSLRYPEVKREFKAVADPDHPGKFSRKIVTTALAFDQKRNGVVRMNLYGGLLAENLVQATARDVFGEHLLSLDEAPGIDVLWTVHDEAICEVDTNVTAKDIESIMSKAPAWMPGLPVAAEAQEVDCYKK